MLVMAYPHNETGIKYSDKTFEDVREYEACIEWNTEGNRLEVWYDTEKYEEVVYERFGEVLCMYDRFYTYLGNDYSDDPIEAQIAQILKDEALAKGYPEKRPTLNPYIAHMRIPISVWFKASDVNEANEVAHKLMDRITKWTRRQGEDALIDDIMSDLLETELIELADDTNDNGVADYTLSESDVKRIIG